MVHGNSKEQVQVEVKLYGDLRKFAPGESSQLELTLMPGATLGDIVDLYAIPRDTYVSLINGRRANRNTILNAGDILVFFPPIAGG
jgi:molybdopterin converting factor small subunit